MAADTQLMKGILEGCILSLLEKEKSYGYRVVERMREFGFSDVAKATIYPIFNRLEKKGDLNFEKRASKLGPPRKYDGLTAQGVAALKAFEESWNNTVKIVNNVLKEQTQ